MLSFRTSKGCGLCPASFVNCPITMKQHSTPLCIVLEWYCATDKNMTWVYTIHMKMSNKQRLSIVCDDIPVGIGYEISHVAVIIIRLEFIADY